MGFLGFGDDAAAAVKDTRSALDQANDGPKDEGVLGNTAHTWISTLLGYGIDGKGPFDSASTVAAEARAKHPDTEAAINALVRKHIALAGAEGFVTSVGGFVTMPVALPVNVFAFYLLATRLTASIASLRGYDLGDPRIRSAVLLAMVGTDADELLSKVGVVAPTGMLTSMVTKQLPAFGAHGGQQGGRLPFADHGRQEDLRALRSQCALRRRRRRWGTGRLPHGQGGRQCPTRVPFGSHHHLERLSTMARSGRVTTLRSLAGALRLAMRPGGPSLAVRASALPRLIRATLRGEYPGTSVTNLLPLVGAVGYVLSPIDLLPGNPWPDRSCRRCLLWCPGWSRTWWPRRRTSLRGSDPQAPARPPALTPRTGQQCGATSFGRPVTSRYPHGWARPQPTHSASRAIGPRGRFAL